MNELFRQYLNGGLSRRRFVSGMSGLGLSMFAANAVAAELGPFSVEGIGEGADSAPLSGWTSEGTGGELLVRQLEAAEMDYIFINPSTSAGPVYDALVDSRKLQIIEAVHEGALLAMADGYARRSGKVPFVMIARPGLPNAMTQMYNSWKDNIPIVLAVDGVGTDSLGQGGFQDIDHLGEMTQPITKWHWSVPKAGKIPEVTRRAIKFASTRPGGPVFLSFPGDTLRSQASALITDRQRFTVPMQIRPNESQVREMAELLLQARNPLLYVGSEITVSGAEDAVVELAELLGLPVVLAGLRAPEYWSMPFPTRHPLYLGQYLPEMRYPGKIDALLNLGGKMPAEGGRPQISPETRLIQVRMDATSMGRNYPTDIAVFADIRLAALDLLAELKRQASPRQLRGLRDSRFAATQAFTSELTGHHQSIAEEWRGRYPISIEHVLLEMESALPQDTCVVMESDSGATAVPKILSFGGANKHYLGNTGIALGWGLPAAFGAKLAEPNRPVAVILGDGAFLFSGPQPLWSYARYRAPITVIVLNNKSYNGERNRIWASGGRQFETGRDMVCYIGDPDVNFVKLAAAFEVPGEVVDDPSTIDAALMRALEANRNGKPYLLDVHVERRGPGSLSTWHPEYSIEALRTRKV